MKTMKISVRKSYMVHESGTKFYQVFEFRPTSDGSPCTMTHWGKTSKSGHTRPVNGGETQLKTGAIARTVITAKVKRGYNTPNEHTEFYDHDESWWHETFGATLTHELQMAMFPLGLAAGLAPTVEPETIESAEAIELPESRPASWGMW